MKPVAPVMKIKPEDVVNRIDSWVMSLNSMIEE